MVRRVGLVCLAVAAMSAGLVVAAQARPQPIPDNLKVPDGNVLLFKAFASGVQNYVCTAQADNPDSFAWTFKAPAAELQNAVGQKVGTHYAGPSWEGNDGSKVVGEVMARADVVGPVAIPWLLLKAKSNDGAGAFSAITYIQRLDTVGGVAPAEGCDRPTVGAERAVPYRATYAFYFGADSAGAAPVQLRSEVVVAPAPDAAPPVYADWQLNEMQARHPEP
jgi:hypothetical protein